uniref:Uncharacterized protein n=1 Tax=Tetranychus urticae TaxID=32264 RepID=T1K4M6_TETUR
MMKNLMFVRATFMADSFSFLFYGF